MNIVERAKNICVSPATEWSVISEEQTPPGSLVTTYVIPLVALGAIASFLGGSFIGRSVPFLGTYRVPIVAGLSIAIFTFVMAIVGSFIVSLIVNALAPSFGGQKDSSQAFKVTVYSYTPIWLAGVLGVLPIFGIGLISFIAGIYGLYLLYLGLPRLMKCPPDKAAGYTVVSVICAIIVGIVGTGVTAMVAGAGMLGTGMLNGALRNADRSSSSSRSSDSGNVQFDKNSPLGKLQELGNKLEESNKKMEAAQKSGDSAAQASAALEGLGTLLGGGKRVEPMAIDQLKPFVPESFAGLSKTRSNAEKNGLAGFNVSKAEATYGDGAQKSVTLEITDTGGVSGIMALAGWAALQQEKDDDEATERTRKVDGRLVHERASKKGGTNEFGVVLGDRFMVDAKGNGVSLDQLRSAVSGLELGRLESLKDEGAQK
jgi:hypothetical protein